MGAETAGLVTVAATIVTATATGTVIVAVTTAITVTGATVTVTVTVTAAAARGLARATAATGIPAVAVAAAGKLRMCVRQVASCVCDSRAVTVPFAAATGATATDECATGTATCRWGCC